MSWLELSRPALHRNIDSLCKLAGKSEEAVCVKANAYGHGLPEIVRLLGEDPRMHYITVHSLDEAIAARDAGWDRRIMVLGPLPRHRLSAVVVYDLEPVIFDKPTLKALGIMADRKETAIRTHLKLETGTNRQGITSMDLPGFAKIYQKYPGLKKPYGAGMHFANIEDTTSHEYAEFQLANFKKLVAEMRKLKIGPKIRHTACSAALVLFGKTHFELSRPGISAYGHWSSKETYLSYRLRGGGNDLFQPVLSWRARITQLKRLGADSFIGYGCTYRTTSTTRLAIVPVGYADGYDRRLSNLAYVLVRGRRAPVRGRICMNLMMVDVTDITGVSRGDEVTLIGRDGNEVITAEQLGQWAGTINYEILSRLSPNLPRIIED